MDEVYYCGSQMVYIGVFVVVGLLIIITCIYLSAYGRPRGVVIEFFLGLVLDQAKALAAQPLVNENVKFIDLVCVCKKTWHSPCCGLAGVE